MNVIFNDMDKAYGIIAQYVENTARDSAAFPLLFFLTPCWGSPSSQHVIKTFILFWFSFQLNLACFWVSEASIVPNCNGESGQFWQNKGHNWTELTVTDWIFTDYDSCKGGVVEQKVVWLRHSSSVSRSVHWAPLCMDFCLFSSCPFAIP